MNDLTHRIKPSSQVANVGQDLVMLSLFERLATDPTIPLDRVEKLLSMQRELRDDQARKAFYTAMADMQSELPVVDEKGQIRTSNAANARPQSTYAKWADINEAIMPALKAHGFSLTFKIATSEKITVTGILSHREGHHEQTSITLPVDTSGSKNAVQAVASSVSYGKRYTAGALLNLTSRAKEDADDDGRAAAGAVEDQSLVSESQVVKLREALEFVGRDETRFCKAIKVESLSDIRAAKFQAALDIINKMGRRQ